MFKIANTACIVVTAISDDLESVYRDMASCVTSNSIFKKRVLVRVVKVFANACSLVSTFSGYHMGKRNSNIQYCFQFFFIIRKRNSSFQFRFPFS